MASCGLRSNRRIAPIACVLAIVVIVSAVRATSQEVHGPKQYYLALGDSITYGYQAYKHAAGLPPTRFDTGYVDVFAAHLRQIQPAITVVNYGCPGESTRSFRKGPCAWAEFGEQLHDNFTGRQLDAALSFLRAHPGEVSPITLTLWGNNVREFSAECQGDAACIESGAFKFIDDLSKDLQKILNALRKEAPNADIIVTGSWDSFIDALEFADPFFQLLNASMAATAAAEQARFANPFPLFNPQGDLQREVETLCALLLLCTQNDSHPSDLGYRVLGDLVWNASGYGAPTVDVPRRSAMLPLAVLRTSTELAFHVLLRPLVAQDAVDVASAASVWLPVEHGKVSTADDLFRLRPGHRGFLAVLRAVPQRLTNLLFRPAVVDDATAVSAQTGRIGIAFENVLIGASHDLIGVEERWRPAIPAPASEARGSDANRRDQVVPANACQILDVRVESFRLASEVGLLEDRDVGVAVDSDRGDLIPHVPRQRVEI